VRTESPVRTSAPVLTLVQPAAPSGCFSAIACTAVTRADWAWARPVRAMEAPSANDRISPYFFMSCLQKVGHQNNLTEGEIERLLLVSPELCLPRERA